MALVDRIVQALEALGRSASYAEAHHLRPLGGRHRGIDDAGNILIVCPNHHIEFDYGAIAVHLVELTVIHIDPHYSLIGKPVLFTPPHKIND